MKPSARCRDVVLERLRIQNFRNIGQADLAWGAGLNLVVGGNGQGKTNLLEAIALLASGRSFRRVPAAVLRRHGQEGFYLHGEVESGGLRHRLEISARGAQQTVRLNGKGVTASSAMGRALAAVVLTPDAPALVRGAPEERRNHLDWILFCQEPSHAGVVRDYQTALRSRNHLLRSQCADGRQWDAWESRLAELGAQITWKRRRMLRLLEERLSPFLEAMALDPAGYRWQMRPPQAGSSEEWVAGEQTAVASGYQAALRKSRQSDQRAGCTSVGPHREDPLFLQNGRALARFGSRGQQKRFLLALKLAEAELLRARLGESPLLLLDDPTTELDREGIVRLMGLLAAGENQLFLATCTAEEIVGFTSRPVCCIRVEEGVFGSDGATCNTAW
ncbi:MAG: DNA replication/repair protein RecF [Magnetococcus sp. MYC-9]